MFRYRLLERQALMLIGFRGSRQGAPGATTKDGHPRWKIGQFDGGQFDGDDALSFCCMHAGSKSRSTVVSCTDAKRKALTLHCEISIRPMTALGQKRRGSERANVVRFAPESGHIADGSRRPLRANGRRQFFRAQPNGVTLSSSCQRDIPTPS